MSAAATAAGYLYASGRLRGKGAREGHDPEHPRDAAEKPKRRELRVAVYAPEHQQQAPQRQVPQQVPQQQVPQQGAKKTPKIEYRTRRWRPE
jgi:hypothetical protein